MLRVYLIGPKLSNKAMQLYTIHRNNSVAILFENRSLKKSTNIINAANPSQTGVQNVFNIAWPSGMPSTASFAQSNPTFFQNLHQNIRSSSLILSDDDLYAELDCYFEHLLSKFKNDKEKFMEAKEILKQQDVKDLKRLKKVSLEGMLKISITLGIANEIVSRMKKFKEIDF